MVGSSGSDESRVKTYHSDVVMGYVDQRVDERMLYLRLLLADVLARGIMCVRCEASH